jgi:hypothetical protein
LIQQDQHTKRETKIMAGKKFKSPTPWEIAKPLLEQDFLEGRATADMRPREVIKLRDEYKRVKIENFRSNWKALKERIQAHKTRATEDADDFLHDKQLHTLAQDLPGYWDGSAAQRLLIDDVHTGRHKAVKPKQLRLSRVEYQDFDLQVFRKHIYQETRSHIETPYWIYKKKKKEQRLGATQHQDGNEDDTDFFDDPVLNL